MTDPVPTARLRMPRSALVAVVVLVVCTVPLASANPWLVVLFALPVLVGVYVWRSGVDVDAGGVTVRAAFGASRVPWPQVAGLQVRDRGELWLVRRNGSALRLPTMRSRDLPRLHAATDGRLGVPAD